MQCCRQKSALMGRKSMPLRWLWKIAWLFEASVGMLDG